eukprot:14176521-Heterocapsa_arctica.AAC.1
MSERVAILYFEHISTQQHRLARVQQQRSAQQKAVGAQGGRWADRPAGLPAGRAGWLSCLPGSLAARLPGQLVGRLAAWLAGLLVGGLAHRAAGWLAAEPSYGR